MKKPLLSLLVLILALALVCPALAQQTGDKERVVPPTSDYTRGVPKNPPKGDEKTKEGKMQPTSDYTRGVPKNPPKGDETTKEGKMLPTSDSTRMMPKNPPKETQHQKDIQEK